MNIISKNKRVILSIWGKFLKFNKSIINFKYELNNKERITVKRVKSIIIIIFFALFVN